MKKTLIAASGVLLAGVSMADHTGLSTADSFHIQIGGAAIYSLPNSVTPSYSSTSNDARTAINANGGKYKTRHGWGFTANATYVVAPDIGIKVGVVQNNSPKATLFYPHPGE